MENESNQEENLKVNPAPPSNNFFDRLSKRQKLMIIGAFVLIVIIFLLGFFLQSRPKTSQTQNTATAPVKQTAAFPTVAPTPVLVAPTSWYTIKTQYYSVNVPKDWRPVVQTMQGGVSVIIRPTTSAPEEPLLVVESYDSPVNLSSKIALFAAEGLTKSNLQFSNTQPVMLSGTWGTRTIDSKTIKTPTQERIVYIPHGTAGFAIRFYYSSPKPQTVYDTVFEKVLSSFTPTQ